MVFGVLIVVTKNWEPVLTLLAMERRNGSTTRHEVTLYMDRVILNKIQVFKLLLSRVDIDTRVLSIPTILSY